jgi:hypothetical protein
MHLKTKQVKWKCWLILMSLLAVSLVGCSRSKPVQSLEENSITVDPSPVESIPKPALTSYPGPGAGYPPMPGDDPQPGDDSYSRGRVSLDLDSSQVIATLTDPSTVYVFLNGTLPGPCQVLRVVAHPPGADSTVNIDAYSLVNPFQPCPGGPNPFSTTVYLGEYHSWGYTVRVNGEQLVEISKIVAPQPGDGALTRAEVALDMTSTKLATTGTQPDIMAVNLRGNLPDSCHQLRIVPATAEAGTELNLDVYSVFDPNRSCAALAQPFHVVYPLGYTTGQHTIIINGQFIGKFDWGG